MIATKKTSIRTSKAKKASEALLIPNLPALDLLGDPLDSDLERDREIEEIVQDIYERDTAGMRIGVPNTPHEVLLCYTIFLNHTEIWKGKELTDINAPNHIWH